MHKWAKKADKYRKRTPSHNGHDPLNMQHQAGHRLQHARFSSSRIRNIKLEKLQYYWFLIKNA